MVVAYSAVLLCLKRAWTSWLGFILFRPKNVKPCRSSQEHPIAQEDFHVDVANVAERALRLDSLIDDIEMHCLGTTHTAFHFTFHFNKMGHCSGASSEPSLNSSWSLILWNTKGPFWHTPDIIKKTFSLSSLCSNEEDKYGCPVCYHPVRVGHMDSAAIFPKVLELVFYWQRPEKSSTVIT